MKLNINNKQSIELIYWIFERELKPPFRIGEAHSSGWTDYYNRDNEFIGWLKHNTVFLLEENPFSINIKYKVCTAFKLNTHNWITAIRPHLKYWMENQINVKLKHIY